MTVSKLTKNDIAEYFYVFRTTYGERAFPAVDTVEFNACLKFWFNCLKDYPKEAVDVAIEKVLKESEFAPKIATIIKAIESIKEVDEKDDYELWEELEDTFYDVADNASRYYYDISGVGARERNQAIFDGLSSEIKGYIRNVGQLITLATADETTISVEKARFLKALPYIREREKIKKKYSPEFRNLIGQVNFKQIT